MTQNADTLLKYLVAGLVEATETDFRYPYPALWQQALNMLTAFQIRSNTPIPKTIPALLEMLENPIGEWWPGELPEVVTLELDQAFTLMFGGQPDDWAYEFLEANDLASISSPARFQDELTQMGMKKLRDLYRVDAETMGYAYVKVRRFLIENSVTTLADIQQTLGSLPLLRMKQIMAFYESEDEFLHRALYQSQFWRCPYCGAILNWLAGVPRCARHSICGRLSGDYRGRSPIQPTGNLFRLKESVLRRVCVPGLPEVRLYDWAKNLQSTDNGLVSVILWPGVDQYDLQLCFADNTTWAIDIKDYADPFNLGRKVRGKSFYSLGTLRWDQGYYVFPQYRLNWNRNYVQHFNQAAELPVNIIGIGEADFKELVIRKLADLAS
ncbi:MAG: hypothetical protein BroJett011_41680 [Chloroflexota bacterium]|nr:MAG: hypothetical protein BroJett011_41680 [Chloroflexota bacterium]